MAILVTGGAGYIGSVAAEALRNGGEAVVVVDNLVHGHRRAVNDSIPFFKGEIGDRDLISRILDEHSITECMHFSAYAYVGESVEQPARYFENNVSQTVSLLEQLEKAGVERFVFSSTCASYGEPQYVPIDEKHPQMPTNPYGWSKFMVERILESYDAAYGLRSVSLRYFNAAGATGTHGEHHDPETHLIPLVLQAARGKREHVSIFGDDYPTPDGTAIRDYIHVSDLGRAHILALEYLRTGGKSEFFNLGNGNGYSVKEVIKTAEKVTGRTIKSKPEPRREGDPSKLIADANKAFDLLGWKPEIPKLEQIIESAWNWHEAHPNGFGE